MTRSKTLLAIPGSLRRGSHNRQLLQAAAELAPPHWTVALYDRLGRLPHFDEDLERDNRGGPEVRALREQVASADGVLIATPEYNQSLPGVLKNAIDWLSRPGPEEVLIGKPVAVFGATTGRWGTRLAQAAVRQTLTATEALLLPTPALYVREADKAFDPGGRLVDPGVSEALRTLLLAFDRWIDRVRGG